MKSLKTLGVAALLGLTIATAFAAPNAEARSHVYVGFNYGPSYYARPYYAYPAYPAYGYAPAPVYYGPPVYEPQVAYGAVVQPQVLQAPPQTANAAPGYCREYNTKVFADGAWRKAYGTACMERDGQWHIIN